MADDSLFGWAFVSHTGDQWSGVLIQDTAAYDAGTNFAFGNGGRYYILSERPLGLDLSEIYGRAYEDGVLVVSSYYDAQSGISAVPTAAGSRGLGSEGGTVVLGFAADTFGWRGITPTAFSQPDTADVSTRSPFLTNDQLGAREAARGFGFG